MPDGFDFYLALKPFFLVSSYPVLYLTDLLQLILELLRFQFDTRFSAYIL
jgi:hypothetical protein